VSTFIQDVRYGLRTLYKSPGFTIVAIITLALGIGANTAIFSIVNAVLLKPLPVPEPDRLLFVTSAFSNQQDVARPFAMSYPDFFDLRSTARSFTGLSAYHGDSFTLTGLAQPLHINGVSVSGDFFTVVGKSPLLGRGFTLDEEKPGSRVVVLSHHLWETSFHGDRSIVGRNITLDKQSYTVVGVMPAGFLFPREGIQPEVWRTTAADGETSDPKEPAATTQRGAHFLQGIARLKPGVSFATAKEELNVITRNLAAQYPDTNKKFPVATVLPELEHLVGRNRTQLVILLVSVAVVLLIACLNVANLLLVRASGRNKEIALRAALGASRMRVVRQMLTESMVLGLAGALLGIPLAWWALKVFISLNGDSMRRIQGAGLDGSVLAFTAAIALLTSILFVWYRPCAHPALT